MYIPSAQTVITALALTSLKTPPPTTEIISGKIMDYAQETCKDDNGNKRCSKPFRVDVSTCYNLHWNTAGALTHTTAEVRDVGSGELVYYRDTDGPWNPEKSELVRLDFKPKIPGTGNDTVEFRVTICDSE